MRGAVLLLFMLFFSCSHLIDPPKNLISKDKMAVLIAEFSLNEQMISLSPENDMDNSTRFDLKKQNVKGTDFVESYKYYLATGDLEKILNEAQEIILEKDPAAKDFIEKKLKENKGSDPVEN